MQDEINTLCLFSISKKGSSLIWLPFLYKDKQKLLKVVIILRYRAHIVCFSFLLFFGLRSSYYVCGFMYQKQSLIFIWPFFNLSSCLRIKHYICKNVGFYDLAVTVNSKQAVFTVKFPNMEYMDCRVNIIFWNNVCIQHNFFILKMWAQLHFTWYGFFK